MGSGGSSLIRASTRGFTAASWLIVQSAEDAENTEYPNSTFARPTPRLLMRDDVETRRARAAGMAIAILFGVAYLLAILQYWAPAHPGVDQNGYLVGGKQLAKTGSTGLLPDHALGFVGAMWVRVEETGVNYPKYPNGLPLLYATSIWIFGDDLGTRYAFLVSPIGAALSVLGTYLLARQFAGVFASLGAMMLMATSQVMLSLANNPNSHASCLACVVWGTFFLVRFWQTASIWRGLAGGFLLGYAVTIRYTEGLLAIPIALVVLSMVRGFDWRQWLRLASPVVGWAIPVAYLAIFNLVAMGTLTGYDTTNESKPGAAFTLNHVFQNWEKLIRQVHDSGLFFAVPVGVLGLILAWRAGWKRAALLWLWLIPGTLTYMAYYWAPDRGVSYLRFFLTLLPPIAVGCAVLFDELTRHVAMRRYVGTLACAGVLAMSCGLGAYRSTIGLDDGVESANGLEQQAAANRNLAELGATVKGAVPDDAVVFASPSQLHYLQFIGNYECYSPEYFTPSFVQRLERTDQNTDDANDPMTQQGARRKWLLSVVQGKSEAQLTQMQNDLTISSLQAGRKVYMVLNRQSWDQYNRRFIRRNSPLQATVVARYYEMPRVDRAERSNTDPAARRPGGNPFGGRGGRAGAGGQPQQWQIVELSLKRTTR